MLCSACWSLSSERHKRASGHVLYGFWEQDFARRTGPELANFSMSEIACLPQFINFRLLDEEGIY